MVRLHGARLHNVRINRTLCQKTDALQLAGLLLKHADKLCADNLALLLRIGHTSQLIEEAVCGIHINQIGVQLVTEHFDHLLRLTLAQQSVVHMHRHQLLANCLDQQGSHY